MKMGVDMYVKLTIVREYICSYTPLSMSDCGRSVLDHQGDILSFAQYK